MIAGGVEKADAYAGRGAVYAHKGDSDRALADFNEAIHADPQAPAGYAQRAKLYQSQGSLWNAAADYSKAIELGRHEAAIYAARGDVCLCRNTMIRPSPIMTRLCGWNRKTFSGASAVARLFDRQRSAEAAIQEYSRVIQRQPDQVEAYAGRGRVYLRNEDWQGAIADLSQAIRRDPAPAQAYLDRATALEKKGDRAACAGGLCQGRATGGEGRQRRSAGDRRTGRTAAAARPHSRRPCGEASGGCRACPLRLCCDACRRACRHGAADRDRQSAPRGEAVAQDQTADAHRAAKPAQAADNHLRRAQSLHAKATWRRPWRNMDRRSKAARARRMPMPAGGRSTCGRATPDRALADFNEAIHADPQAPAAYAQRAKLFQAHGSLLNAAADYSKAIDLGLHEAAVYAGRGDVYLAQDREDRAQADYDEALRLEPENAQLHLCLARGFSTGRRTRKRPSASTASPSNGNPIWSRPMPAAASCISAEPTGIARFSDLSEAIRRDPSGAQAYLDRATALEKKGIAAARRPITRRRRNSGAKVAATAPQVTVVPAEQPQLPALVPHMVPPQQAAPPAAKVAAIVPQPTAAPAEQPQPPALVPDMVPPQPAAPPAAKVAATAPNPPLCRPNSRSRPPLFQTWSRRSQRCSLCRLRLMSLGLPRGARRLRSRPTTTCAAKGDQEADNHLRRAKSLERQGELNEALAEYQRAIQADVAKAEAYAGAGKSTPAEETPIGPWLISMKQSTPPHGPPPSMPSGRVSSNCGAARSTPWPTTAWPSNWDCTRPRSMPPAAISFWPTSSTIGPWPIAKRPCGWSRRTRSYTCARETPAKPGQAAAAEGEYARAIELRPDLAKLYADHVAGLRGAACAAAADWRSRGSAGRYRAGCKAGSQRCRRIDPPARGARGEDPTGADRRGSPGRRSRQTGGRPLAAGADPGMARGPRRGPRGVRAGDPRRPQPFRGFAARAAIFSRKGDLTRALADYVEAIRLNPQAAGPVAGRGRILQAQGNYLPAIEEYSKALSLGLREPEARCGPRRRVPGQPAARSGTRGLRAGFAAGRRTSPRISACAQVLEGQDNRQEAIEEYDKVIALRPQGVAAYVGLRGCTSYAEWDAAIGDLSEVIRLDPNNAEAYLSRATALQEKGDIVARLADAVKARQLGAKSPATVAAARCAAGQRCSRQASQPDRPVRRIVAGEPQAGRRALKRGQLLQLQGELDKALADYEAALQLGLHDPQIYFGRGMVGAVKGQWSRPWPTSTRPSAWIRMRGEYLLAPAGSSNRGGESGKRSPIMRRPSSWGVALRPCTVPAATPIWPNGNSMAEAADYDEALRRDPANLSARRGQARLCGARKTR